MPVVGVYRWFQLPASETFIRNQCLALRRYQGLFIGEQRDHGLHLPRERVVLGTPGGRVERVLRRRLSGRDSAERLARACRKRRVDVIHAHFGTDGIAALELARRLRTPLAVTFHGFDATLTDDALHAAGGALETYRQRRGELFDEAVLLIAVSEFIAHELARVGAPEDKIRVHHIGVPLGSPEVRVPSEPLVLFVGRHVEKKGLGDLIDAMVAVQATVPNADLVVIGDGPLRPTLEARARAQLRHPRFLGWVAPDRMRDHFGRARVLCVPSKRAENGDAEGLPMVIPEAGAAGLPVVATRHSGIPEAIEDGENGLLAAEGDVEGLGEALSTVLTDDALWQRLSSAARSSVERDFDIDRQTAGLELLYDEALRVSAR